MPVPLSLCCTIVLLLLSLELSHIKEPKWRDETPVNVLGFLLTFPMKSNMMPEGFKYTMMKK
jgi:hypothetical protein